MPEFRQFWLCWVGLAWVLTAGQTRAQEILLQREHKATLTVVSGLTPERTLRLSGEVRVRIEVIGKTPLMVDPGETSGDAHWKIEAEAPKQSLTGLANQLETWRWDLVLVPLQPGDHPVPVPGLSYREGDDEKRYDVQWRPPVFRVLTQIGKADIKAAKDITDIESSPVTPPAEVPWSLLAFFAGVVVLVGLGGWLVVRRRRGVVLPPHQVALRELDRLARQEPATAPEVERHHRELAQVVRHYLDQRFQLPAQRRTSAELANELRQATLLTEEQQTLLADILTCCDLAKFARVTATVAECQTLVTRARGLVEQTTSTNNGRVK